MNFYWRACAFVALPLFTVGLAKLQKNSFSRPSACAQDSLRFGSQVNVDSTVFPHTENCAENKLKVCELVPCSANVELGSSIELHLCGDVVSRYREPKVEEFPVNDGPKTMDFDAYMERVDKYTVRKKTFREIEKDILIRHFGANYESLFEINDIPSWKITLNQSFRRANLIPRTTDSVAIQLKTTSNAKLAVDRLSDLYKYIPQGDIRMHVLKEMKMRSDYLRQHENYLKGEYEKNLKKIMSG